MDTTPDFYMEVGKNYTSDYVIFVGPAVSGNLPWILQHDQVIPPGLNFGFRWVEWKVQSGWSLVVSGTPTTVGTTKVVAISRQDHVIGSDTIEKTIEVNIVVADVIITALPELPQRLIVDKAISPVIISAAGGKAPYSYHLGSGALPEGLTFDPGTQTLSGTPKKTGAFSFWLGATDQFKLGGHEGASSGWKKFEGVIEPEITVTGSPYRGVAGEAYYDVLSAKGGAGSYTFVKGDEVPDGVTLGASSGRLDWPSPTWGRHTFWLGAHDGQGNGGTKGYPNGWLHYTVEIAPEPDISFSPPTSLKGRAGSSYSGTVHASGGTSPYTYELVSGPAGLEVSSGGHITWTPHQTGPSNVSVRARDAKGHTGVQDFTIEIASKLSFSSNLPNVVEGHKLVGAYVHAYNGTSPYKYSLPGSQDLGIDEKTGALSGTPTRAGTIKFSVAATDDSQYKYTGDREFSLVVEPVVSIMPPSEALEGYVDEPFSATFRAEGGSGSYTYQIFGTPPAGLSVHGGSGVLSGIPTQSGRHSFVLGVAECSAPIGNGINGRQEFSIDVHAGIEIKFTDLKGMVGQPYKGTIHATGGKGAYKFVVTGLKNGLTANANYITGTPTQPGPINLTVSVRDDHGTKKENFQIDVIPAAAVELAIGKLLRGHFTRISGSQNELLTITGQLAGGGLSEAKDPKTANVVLQLRQPGKPSFLEVEKDQIGTVKWESKWKSDGWEFTISGIKWQPGDALPEFTLFASSPTHQSEQAIIKFPLKELVTNIGFRDDGDDVDELAIKSGDQNLTLHMGFYNPIDKLSVKVGLPDGVTVTSLPQTASLPPALKFRSNWDGHLQPILFEISDKEKLTLKDHKPLSLNISIPINITGTFRSGQVKVDVTSDSSFVEYIPNDTEKNTAHLTLTKSS